MTCSPLQRWYGRRPARRGLLVAILLSSALLGCQEAPQWEAVEQSLHAQYPAVQPISTDSLAAWLQDPTVPAPLLLDVRTRGEYEVSHLQDAHLVAPEERHFTFLENVPHDTPIVTYCSVGFRSAAVAERLLDAGYRNVYNLSGSIFKWANEGRPVYRDGEPVAAVHPYDDAWSVLLRRDLRAYEVK